MFCSRCGTAILNEETFCTNCGTALERVPNQIALLHSAVGSQVPSPNIRPDDPRAAEPPSFTSGSTATESVSAYRWFGRTGGTTCPGDMPAVWVLLAIAVGLAVVIGLAIRRAPIHAPLLSVPAAAGIAPASNTLRELGSHCHVKTAGGQEIEFENLPINTTLDDTVSSNEVCAFARDAAARWDRESVNDTRSICQITGPAVFAKLGVTNWSGVAIQARSDRDAPDGGVGLEEFAEGCLNPTTIGVKIAESHSYLRIFSIGSIVWNAHRCRAYVRELMHADQQRGDSDLYELIGTQACAHFPTNSQPDATDENPNPSPPGDYWRTAYHYSGPMPVEAKYHGHTYAFATGDNTVDIETTTVVSHAARSAVSR